MSTGNLDGSFVGFGARVTEKGLVGTRVLAQPVGQGGLSRDEVEVGNMVDSLNLLDDSFVQGSVGVTQGTSGNSTDTIQILLSIGCFQPASFARFNSQRVSAVLIQEEKKIE